MSEETGDQSAEGSKQHPDGKMPWGCLGLIAAPIVLFAATCAGGMGDDEDYRDDPAMQRVDAERYCKAEVDARLKAPSTADYSGVSSSGYGTITVTGWVDAENAFGAALRNSFRCQVTLVGDSWRLDDISVG